MLDFGHDLAQLGLRREGAYFIDEAREVGVLVGEFGVFAGWLEVAWSGPAIPAAQLRDVVHLPFPNPDQLAGALVTARAKRAEELLACTSCGKNFTRRQMDQIDGGPVCHGCAETDSVSSTDCSRVGPGRAGRVRRTC